MLRLYQAHGYPLAPDSRTLDYLVSRKDILVTDSPSELLGTKPLYTITSTLALGSDLLPYTYLHIKNGLTHRGLSQALLQVFFTVFGDRIGTENVGSFVWCSPSIDPEQYVIETDIASRRQEFEERLISLLFDIPSHIQDGWRQSLWDMRLNPNLIKLIDMLKNNQEADSDLLISQYVKELLQTFFQATGIRQRWYRELSDLLTGRTKASSYSDRASLDMLAFELQYALGRFSKTDSYRPLQPAPQIIVLEIDPQLTCVSPGLYAVQLGIRPLDTIIGMTSIPRSAITAAFTQDVVGLEAGSDIKIRTLDDIPDEAWLTINGRPVRPQDIRHDELDPLNPLCNRRYEGDPTNQTNPLSFWVKLMLQGKLALVGSKSVNLLVPGSYSDQLMKALIERMIREADEFKEATETIGRESQVLYLVTKELDGYRYGITFPLAHY